MGISFLAVILGWLSIELVAMVLGFGASATGMSLGSAQPFLLYVAGPIAAFVGGYVAANVAKRAERLHAILACGISVLIALFIGVSQASLSAVLAPNILLGWALTFAAAILGSLLREKTV